MVGEVGHHLGSGSDVRPGDWYCTAGNCGAHNFASRSSCFKCGVYKDDSAGGFDSDIPRSRGFGSGSNRSGWKSGDWICTRHARTHKHGLCALWIFKIGFELGFVYFGLFITFLDSLVSNASEVPMASCGLGASNIKLPKLDFDRARVGNLRQWNGTRTWIGRREVQYAGLTISYEPKKVLSMCCGPKLETESATNRVDGFKEIKSSDLTSQLIPNSTEVESLVTEICNTSSIAEFELKFSILSLLPFVLPVDRLEDLGYMCVDTSIKAPDSNGSVSSTSLAISKPVPFSGGIKSFLDRAADEGLMILQSPRKQIVKEGQVICYIEQLGGEIPIESDVSGEVIKILREDGEPVGYGDALIAILPSFPGIKKLH
ncbi:hypothetical protein GH714_034357 [Hevea brasiliensis]|uniref:RanBP2-type domain-containing protein n=1 Tax=Hevea brasiliensis TaxID=3981 RepID=A0A6A6NCL8_HEVBR|nr:hypothetical protein GH714_034357 [Hevea brasiliensis]